MCCWVDRDITTHLEGCPGLAAPVFYVKAFEICFKRLGPETNFFGVDRPSEVDRAWRSTDRPPANRVAWALEASDSELQVFQHVCFICW